MRCIITALLLLLLCATTAQAGVFVGFGQSESGGGYDVLYDFEESGTPVGITPSGSVSFDTQGINGESAYIDAASSSSSFYYNISHTSGSKVWTRSKIKFSHLPTGTSTSLTLMQCANLGVAKGWLSVVNIDGISYFRVLSAGGSNVTGTTALSTNTVYTVDFACAEGSGSNSFTGASFSTSGTPDHSGDNYIESTDGTNTSNINRIYFVGAYASSVNYNEIYIDDISEPWDE